LQSFALCGIVSPMQYRFPSTFVFGAATSSYQIEGAEFDDGATASIWSMFTRLEGTISDASTGLTACDHYHHYPEDVALMSEMGIQAYRFSLSWSRIWPDTSGEPNPAGVDFYRNLLIALKDAGIRPIITLFHWDLPLYLHEKGGWTSPQIAEDFASYSEKTVALFQDLCDEYITLNEPWVFMHKGYLTGEHAPGVADRNAAGSAYINILKSHRLAMQRLRARFPNLRLSIACNLAYVTPSSDKTADIDATQRQHAYQNEFFLDPWLLGRVPLVAYSLFPEQTAELAMLDGSPPIQHDMVCINYYSKCIIRHETGGFLDSAFEDPRGPVTAMNWEVSPEGFTTILKWVHDRYSTPIWVTENGSAYPDTVVDGEIMDEERTAYLQSHLNALYLALNDGVNVEAYFAWSLLDNFEWECGYDRRFGLVHVDFKTQKRTIKQSGRLYSDIVRSQESLLERI